ncbi:hypothetical protein Bca52824_036299 [Brassica carinata]|uniref:RING-type domain-containing protein n=1 Tax=Brassica carinata TaxID=52824 RepID=A0A8X7S4L8_BRACI|nr:hypothetical protein Bca52824_036299 [Brassica carinata]
MNPTLLNRDGLRQLRNRQQHCSAGSSLDRGFDQRSSIRTQEKHETGFELRSSQPSMDFGERQFRHGPRSSIHEHHEMPSHGYGPSGGIGNLQEKVIAADMIGPVDSNGLRLGDVGSHQSRYTLQGYPGDGGSFPVKILEDWTTKPVESLDFHSQTKEHQQNSMDMVSMIKHNEKKQKMSPSDSSQFGYCSPREIGIQYKRMGIDIQRIVKIESLPLEHFCLVCQLLINPNEALQSMCGHLYCKPCLTYIASTTRTCPYDGYLVTESYAKPLVESNKVLADAIGKTLVYCSYQESGCTWVGSLADSSFHCSDVLLATPMLCAAGANSYCTPSMAEHVQVCLGAYTQASVATATTQASVVMAISQACAQGHAVASAMMTQEQWYQQPYQQYYQNYIEDYMQQQPMQRQSFAPHDQVIYVQAGPAVHYEADQTHSQMLPQPQVQSQSLAMHQPHDAFPSPQDNTVQDSRAQNTVSQCLSNQPHASGNVVQNPQQPDKPGRSSPNNMIMHDEDNFLEQVSRVRLPQSLPTIQMEQNPLPSQLTRDQHTNQTVLKYGGALAPESSDMHSSQQPFSIPSLSQQHRATSTTGAVHNQMNHEGPSYHPHIALQEHQAKSINNDPSLDGIPQMNPTLLNRDGLRQLRNRQQHCSAGSSLDRGFDQRSSIRTQEKHETGFELRSSQPSMDFGERQFRHGPRSSIHEHHEMPSHGYGPSGGIGNLQEKVIAADMIGPVDSNGLRLGDVGSHQSRYTLQGYPGDGGSFPVKILEDWTTKPVESLDFHSQTKEHQQNSMDMVSMIKHNEKKQKM